MPFALKIARGDQRGKRSLRSKSPGGEVTTIYEGTGCAIFWGAFYPAENKFWGIIFGKMTSSHKFWGIILEK